MVYVRVHYRWYLVDFVEVTKYETLGSLVNIRTLYPPKKLPNITVKTKYNLS